MVETEFHDGGDDDDGDKDEGDAYDEDEEIMKC